MSAETIDTIAAAIANRYTAANMAAPGGLPAVRFSTSDLPNRLGRLPGVLVFVDSGTMDAGNQSRLALLTFLVRFYLARRRDLPRETNRIRTWLPVLLGQHQAGIALGLEASGVARVWTESYRVGTMQYAGLDYAGVELSVKVKTSLAWAVSA